MKLVSGNFKFEDAGTGDVLIEAPAMDMYCLIGIATDEVSGSRVDRLKHAAEVLNIEYGTSLTWGQVVLILNALDEEITAAKKNSTSTPESQDGTE